MTPGGSGRAQRHERRSPRRQERGTRQAAVRVIGVVCALVLTGWGSGCSSATSDTEPAQQDLPPATGTVRIDDAALSFIVEIPRTAQQRRAGLSHRPSPTRGTGMLFQFDELKPQQVWMAGMQSSLDIAWIARGAVVGTDTLDLCDEPDQSNCPRTNSPGAVDALLEVPADSLTAVAPGMTVTVTHHT